MRASGAVGLCALIVRCAGGLAADRPESSIEVLQALSKRSSVKVYQAAGEHNLPHIRQDGDKVTLQIEQQGERGSGGGGGSLQDTNGQRAYRLLGGRFETPGLLACGRDASSLLFWAGVRSSVTFLVRPSIIVHSKKRV